MLNETPPTTRRRWRVPPVIALPLIAVAAVTFAYVATRPLGGEPQPSFFVIGSAAPGVQIGQVAPGTANAPVAPRLELTDLEDAPVALRDFSGKPLWIIFWKTACQPCEAEAADVAAAYAAHRESGLVLLGIDVWDSAAAISDYAAEHDLAYPIAVDTSTGFMDAYGVWGAPTHYFIGSDGVIRDRYFGPMNGDLIESSLKAILPATAR
ncbi:MAG: TlpA family protein disulfide reductase [Chloroflexi bacterium]|nr:TlpA family protein disulfide reductase [Chloroflexota bacterium]